MISLSSVWNHENCILASLLSSPQMTRDFEQVPRVKAFAIGKVGEELSFSFPEVLAVIHACSRNDIAVLGVELFLVKSDGY